MLRRILQVTLVPLVAIALMMVATPPANAAGETATCTIITKQSSAPGGTSAVVKSWTGRSVKSCVKAGGKLYMIKNSSGKVIGSFRFDGWGAPGPDKFVAALDKGYAAANKFCADNPIVCTVVTGVAVNLITGKWLNKD